MIKAIFFDIDGTLVSFNTHRIPADTLDALRRAESNGIKLFIATGRQHIEAERVLEGFPFDGYITLNGQYCYTGNEIVRKRSIDRSDLRALVNRLRQNPYPCEFVEENRLYLNMVDEAVQKSHAAVDLDIPGIEDIQDVPNRDVFQLVAFFDASREAEEMKYLPNCEATRWSPYFADIVPRGGSKRAGIEAMLARFGLTPGECMAFGDGENDIPMLKYVSVGIAMGNSSPLVMEAAADVTGTVDGGGIHEALRRYQII